MVVVHGDESLDTIRKKSPKKQIQVIEESLVDSNPRFHDETNPRKQVTKKKTTGATENSQNVFQFLRGYGYSLENAISHMSSMSIYLHVT